MRRLGVLLTALVATLLAPTSAVAAEPPAVQVSDTPLAPSGQCTLVPYSYQANNPEGYSNADVTIDVYSPAGNYVSSVYRTGTAGSGEISLCSNPPQGQWQATIRVVACSFDHGPGRDVWVRHDATVGGCADPLEIARAGVRVSSTAEPPATQERRPPLGEGRAALKVQGWIGAT